MDICFVILLKLVIFFGINFIVIFMILLCCIFGIIILLYFLNKFFNSCLVFGEVVIIENICKKIKIFGNMLR